MLMLFHALPAAVCYDNLSVGHLDNVPDYIPNKVDIARPQRNKTTIEHVEKRSGWKSGFKYSWKKVEMRV